MHAAALFFSTEPAPVSQGVAPVAETIPFAQVFAQAQSHAQAQTLPQAVPAEESVALLESETAPAELEVAAEALTAEALALLEGTPSEGHAESTPAFQEATPAIDPETAVSAAELPALPTAPADAKDAAKPDAAQPAALLPFRSLQELQALLFREQTLGTASVNPPEAVTSEALTPETVPVDGGTEPSLAEVPLQSVMQAVSQAFSAVFAQNNREVSWGSGTPLAHVSSQLQVIGVVLEPGHGDALELATAVESEQTVPAPADPALSKTHGLSLDPLDQAIDAAVFARSKLGADTTVASQAKMPLQTPMTLPQAARELDKRFQVFRQVEERLILLRQQHQRELSLQLEPAQLGKLKLRLQQEGALFHLQIIAETPMVKELLDAQIQQLRQQFTAQGFSLDRVEVDVQSQTGDGSPSQDSQGAYVPMVMPLPAASFSLFEAAVEPLPHLTYGSAVSGFYYHQVNYLA